MASKLDGLMGLVHGYARLYEDDRMCEDELSRRDLAFAALQDALKAVVEDAERYRWMRNFGREEDWQHWWELDQQEKLDAAIDAASKL